MGSSSGEADESLLAVFAGITVSLAESKLGLGVPAPVNKIFVKGLGRGNGGGNECDDESFHLCIKLLYCPTNGGGHYNSAN